MGPQQLLLTPFWKLALKDWQSLIPHQPVTVMTPELMLTQPLFLNREIMIDGKVLTQSKWNHIYRKGLKTISHLWKNDHWRSVQEMRQDLNIRIKSKTLYMIRSAIPVDWRDHIMVYPPNPPLLPQTTPLTLFTNIGGPPEPMCTLKCKELRRRLSSLRFQTPPCFEYWENRWDTTINWTHVWKNLSQIPDNKMKDTIWLMIHRRLALSDLLLKRFPDSSFPAHVARI